MKNTSLRWRFINQAADSEFIVVHDENSAQNLIRLLQKAGGDWIVQEERSLSVGASAQNVAAPAPAPAPVPAPVQVAVQSPAPAAAAPTREVVESPHVSNQESTPEAVVQLEVPEAALDSEPPPPHQEEEPVLPAVELAPAVGTVAVPAVQTAADSAVPEIAVVPIQLEVPAAPAQAVAPPPAPKKVEKRERRSSQRYMTEFRVILISGSSSFRAMSQDVSLGGMRLKKSIPASFLKEKCIAYVSHKDLNENIEIVCNVIGDPQDPCRIQFVQPNAVQLKRLNDWLMEHNQPGANRKKAAS
jgi:hypothetical protein